MKIQEQDRYHGPALMQIVEHDSFKALNKTDEKYGHYLVNNDTRLWIKYRTTEKRDWRFTIQPSEAADLAADFKLTKKTYLILVCGKHTICCLDRAQIESLIDAKDASSQWIRVEAPAHKNMRITGSLNKRNPILFAHKRFPSCIFEVANGQARNGIRSGRRNSRLGIYPQ
jgi:hypothetical protein